MKKRFFNFKSLFLVSFLAVAGIFSAGAFVVNKQVEEAPAVEKASADSDKYIYFLDTANWGEGNIRMHNWGTSETEWPGTVMTKVEGKTAGGSQLYKAALKDASNDKVIFSNNGSNQTPNLNIPATQNTYFYGAQGWINWDGTTDISGSKTIYFGKPNNWNWSNLKAYAWIENVVDDSGAKWYNTGWPGASLTSLGTYNSISFYSVSVYSYFENFIFSSNGSDYDRQQGWLSATDKSNTLFHVVSADSKSWKQAIIANYNYDSSTTKYIYPLTSGSNLKNYSSCGFLKPTGMSFTAWNTEALGGGTSYSATQAYSGGSTNLFAQWQGSTTTISFNQNGGSGGVTGTKTATYGSAMPSLSGSSAPTLTNYRFDGYYDGSGGTGTKYYNADLSSAKNWDKENATYTLYAKWVHQGSITYNYLDTNGNTVTGGGTDTHDAGTVTLRSPSVANYHFEKFYTQYNATTHVFSGDEYDAGASYTLSGSTTVTLYAKFVRHGIYLVGGYNGWVSDSTSALTAVDGESGVYKKTVKFTSSTATDRDFKVRVFASDNYVYDYGWNYAKDDRSGDASSYFVDSGRGAGDYGNNIHCISDGIGISFEIVFKSEGALIYTYFSDYPSSGYYLAGTGAFSSNGNGNDWSFDAGFLMDSSPAGRGDNTAVLESTHGFEVSDGDLCKVAYHGGVNSNTWYRMTIGSGSQYAHVVNTPDDDEHYYVEFDVDGNYNFYFKIDNGTNYIYLVNVGETDKFGMLFVASNTASNSLTIQAKKGGTDVGTATAIGSMTGFEEITTIKSFGGKTHLYLIPIYSLRGAATGEAVDNLVLSSGTTLTNIPTSAGESITYYCLLDGTNASCSSSTVQANGKAGKAVFDIAEALETLTDNSICELVNNRDLATALKNSYDAATAASTTLHQDAKIYTYTSTKSAGTKGEVYVYEIYGQIASIVGTGRSLQGSAHRGFSPLNLFGEGEENIPVVIIIITSSVSLLSITALSVLMVRKRKRKEE